MMRSHPVEAGGARSPSSRALLGALLATGLALSGCFGARSQPRSYFVLFGSPTEPMQSAAFLGLLRVQDMDADSAYEKFQIVVRRSPYELRYSDSNVWAVKPSQMLSDILAKTLAESRTFASVTRTLGDIRPKYTLSGDLHAIEVYESDELWFAHLAFTLRMTEFETGERRFLFRFDQRKSVPTSSFSHAVRAMSELLDDALRQVVAELAVIGLSRSHVDDLRTDDPGEVSPTGGDDPKGQGQPQREGSNEDPSSRTPASSGEKGPFMIPAER